MKHMMIRAIRWYQKYLSPLKTTRCPYIPTCSNYALQAIEKPFSHGGYDPVP